MSATRGSRWRRPTLPSQIKARLPQRPLAAQELQSGGWVVLTKGGIVVFDADDAVALDRAWHEVDRGEWESGEAHLQLTWVDGAEPTDLFLATAGTVVADTLHERVQASLVHVEQERAPGGGVLRAAIRRTPSGELISQISVRGTVARGPALERQMTALEVRVRSQVGMAP